LRRSATEIHARAVVKPATLHIATAIYVFVAMFALVLRARSIVFFFETANQIEESGEDDDAIQDTGSRLFEAKIGWEEILYFHFSGNFYL